MATTYKQVYHGEAGFSFVNNTAADIEAGERFKVGALVFFTKDSIPGYNANPTPANPSNTIPWEGRGH